MSAEASAGSMSASTKVDKSGTAEVGVKIDVVSFEDGKGTASAVKVETTLNGTAGSKQKSANGQASPESVTIGGKFGAFAASVSADFGKAADAVGDFFNTIGSYFKSSAKEENDSFFWPSWKT